MGRQSSAKKRRRDGRTEADAKGRLVEQIVASLHGGAGVTVERRVFLPVLGDGVDTREIDVLLTGSFAGYPARFAIECKNEKAPIGVQRIGEFIDKLDDVGIPRACGIYVSVNGYTSGALRRAKTAGIRPLVLRGLTPDRLRSALSDAVQSVVHLLLELGTFSITYEDATPAPVAPEPYILRDETGAIRATLQDIVWQLWIEGELPMVIGVQQVQLPIPENCYQLIDGHLARVVAASVETHVLGLVMQLSGDVTEHALLNAQQDTVERFRISAAFAPPQGTYSLTTVRTEAELLAVVKALPASVTAVTRLRMPRIRVEGVYWPPSERVAHELIRLTRAFEAGEIPDPRPFNVTELEGSDIKTVWEPIWDGHPAAQTKQAWPTMTKRDEGEEE